jgi:hypothetical protein
MSPLTLLTVQSTLSLLACSLLARWYVAPRLATRSWANAVLPLLWIHVFRYAPVALFAPGQVDSRIGPEVRAAVGYGDLAVALVALVAVVSVTLRMRGALVVVWGFCVISIGDLIFATIKAVEGRMYTFYMGWNWYLLTFYVPVLVVSQLMIVYYLVRARPGV